MNQQRAVELFQKENARQYGHFVLRSGRHTPEFIDGKAMLVNTHTLSLITEEILLNLEKGLIETVVTVSPTIGPLGFEVARQLSKREGRSIPFLTAEKLKDGTRFIMHPRYHRFLIGERILLLEDVLTTGGAFRKVLDVIRFLGGQPVAGAVLWDRQATTTADDFNLNSYFPFVRSMIPSYAATLTEPCRLCQEDVEINPWYGHGREYLKLQGKKVR